MFVAPRVARATRSLVLRPWRFAACVTGFALAALLLAPVLARAHGDHTRYPELDPLSRGLVLPRAVAPPIGAPLARLARERYYLANDDHSDYMWSGLDSTYRSAFVRMMDHYMDLADATTSHVWDARSRFVMDGHIWVSEYEKSQPASSFQRVLTHLVDSSLVMPLNACIEDWGMMPTEAVLRSFYGAGHYERLLGQRATLVIPMENQTLPGGVASLWAGSGARYAWKGICNCASCFDATQRGYDIYRFVGPDGDGVLLKWNAFYGDNSNVGGYAEARYPAASLDFMQHHPTYRTRWPYGVHAAFGYGHDNLQTFTREFVDAAHDLSNDTTRVIASNELDFFRDFEATYGASLPVWGRCFGNEWELLSTTLASATAEYKTSVEKLRTAEALASLVVQREPDFMEPRIAERDSAMLACGLYAEHSWGPGPGVTENQREAWQRQIARAITRYADGLQHDALARLGQSVERPFEEERHAVFNPLSWARTDVVDLETDVPEPRHAVDVRTGADLPSQTIVVDAGTRLRVRVAGVPSVGYRVVAVRPGAGTTFPDAATVSGATLAGNAYSLTLGARGQITSLVDHKAGDVERVPAGRSMGDCEQGTGPIVAENVGPVSATLRVVSAGAPDHDVRVTLYADVDRVDVDARITENFGESLENYRYDFAIPNGRFRHEEVGMIARAAFASAGGDYADESARTDWLTSNHFVDLSNATEGITLSTWDGSFWQAGGSWFAHLDSTSAYLHALVGNAPNCADGIENQGGDTFFRNRYAVRTHGAWSAPAAMRFALEHQNPLVAARVTSAPGDAGWPAATFSLVTVDTSDVLLWALKPADEGPTGSLVARLWNLADAPRTALLALPTQVMADPRRVTHVETDLGPATASPSGMGLVETFARQQLKTFRFVPLLPVGEARSPARDALALAVWPNPARGAGAGTVTFALPSASHVRVRVLDVRGAVVRTLADGLHAAGEHALPWRDDGLAPGVYFVRVDRDGQSATRRVVVLR